MTWFFNVGLLFANEYFDGYHFSHLLYYFHTNVSIDDRTAEAKSDWGAILESRSGLIPRWHVVFKVTVLRMIIFNMDYAWSLSFLGSSPIEVNMSTRYLL